MGARAEDLREVPRGSGNLKNLLNRKFAYAGGGTSGAFRPPDVGVFGSRRKRIWFGLIGLLALAMPYAGLIAASVKSVVAPPSVAVQLPELVLPSARFPVLAVPSVRAAGHGRPAPASHHRSPTAGARPESRPVPGATARRRNMTLVPTRHAAAGHGAAAANGVSRTRRIRLTRRRYSTPATSRRRHHGPSSSSVQIGRLARALAAAPIVTNTAPRPRRTAVGSARPRAQQTPAGSPTSAGSPTPAPSTGNPPSNAPAAMVTSGEAGQAQPPAAEFVSYSPAPAPTASVAAVAPAAAAPSTSDGTTSVPVDTGVPADSSAAATTPAVSTTPASTDPAPAPTDPAPAGTDPAPAATDPAPAGTDPAPTATDPAPAATDPAPAATDPAPAATDPAPTTTDPAPAATDPASTDTSPTPPAADSSTPAPADGAGSQATAPGGDSSTADGTAGAPSPPADSSASSSPAAAGSDTSTGSSSQTTATPSQTVTTEQSSSLSTSASASGTTTDFTNSTTSATGSAPPAAAPVVPLPATTGTQSLGVSSTASSLPDAVTPAQINAAAAQELQTAAGATGVNPAVVSASTESAAITAISDLTVKSVGSAMTESLADSTFSTVGSSAGSPRTPGAASTRVDTGSQRAGGFTASDSGSNGSLLVAGDTSPSSQSALTQASSSGIPASGAAAAPGSSPAGISPESTTLVAAPADNHSSIEIGTLGARGPPTTYGPVPIPLPIGGSISTGDATLSSAPAGLPHDVTVGTAIGQAPQIRYLPATGDPLEIPSWTNPTTAPASAGFPPSSTHIAATDVAESCPYSSDVSPSLLPGTLTPSRNTTFTWGAVLPRRDGPGRRPGARTQPDRSFTTGSGGLVIESDGAQVRRQLQVGGATCTLNVPAARPSGSLTSSAR